MPAAAQQAAPAHAASAQRHDVQPGASTAAPSSAAAAPWPAPPSTQPLPGLHCLCMPDDGVNCCTKLHGASACCRSASSLAAASIASAAAIIRIRQAAARAEPATRAIGAASAASFGCQGERAPAAAGSAHLAAAAPAVPELAGPQIWGWMTAHALPRVSCRDVDGILWRIRLRLELVHEIQACLPQNMLQGCTLGIAHERPPGITLLYSHVVHLSAPLGHARRLRGASGLHCTVARACHEADSSMSCRHSPLLTCKHIQCPTVHRCPVCTCMSALSKCREMPVTHG